MRRTAGFTVTEVVVATGLFSLAVAITMRLFVGALHHTKAGTSQASMVHRAMLARQRIMHYVQQCQAVCAMSDWDLVIWMPDRTRQMLRFCDGDSNVLTVADNCILYDPVPDTAGEEQVLCWDVSPIGDTPIFVTSEKAPRYVTVRFHLGDSVAGDERRYATGPGYQGVELRFSVVPRNIGRIYQ